MNNFTLITPVTFSAKDISSAGKKMGQIIYGLTGEEEVEFNLEFNGEEYHIKHINIVNSMTQPPMNISKVIVKKLE